MMSAYKIFNDPVHGHIELPPLCVKIIDTPQFQRLRNIKQLSFCDYVYPGATHSRFEHSLGTCHLAGELVKQLRKQEELCINDKDMLCVQVAALCHDLGHGPFSHSWERLMKKLTSGAEKHEIRSVKMLNHLIKENNLEAAFKDESNFGSNFEKYLEFVKLQISGNEQQRQEYPWTLQGEEDKSFLYEIVSNNDTGMDVDKWDYISRDCHHLGFTNGFNHHRIIRFSRVIEVGDKKRICIQDKELLNVYSMFNARFILHSRVYQHKVSIIIEKMVLDALLLANEHLRLANNLKMSEANENIQAFSMLSDSILQQILSSTEDSLKPAREILETVVRRDLYKFVGEFMMSKGQENVNEKELEDEVHNFCPGSIDRSDIICVKKMVGFGKKDRNPLLRTYFYKKTTATEANRYKANELSRFLPNFKECEEQYAVFFCRKSGESIVNLVKRGFKRKLE